MPEITEAFVDSVAPKASAASSGRALLLGKKFVALNRSDDDTLVFGECRGSGKSNYAVSVDFLDPVKPVYRCTCPSRQIPCKHVLGLMYAWVEGHQFEPAAVPEDVAAKRSRAEQRAAKRDAGPAKPKKVNKRALAKKIEAQLDGLGLLEQLVHDLIRGGLGNVTAKTASGIEARARQLGDAYLPGAQAALRSLTLLLRSEQMQQREVGYTEAMDHLTRLHSMVKRGRAYLRARAEDPELRPEVETDIAAWLGHAWQLTELEAAGLTEDDVELVQLAFEAFDDPARRAMIDRGWWVRLGGGGGGRPGAARRRRDRHHPPAPRRQAPARGRLPLRGRPRGQAVPLPRPISTAASDGTATSGEPSPPTTATPSARSPRRSAT